MPSQPRSAWERLGKLLMRRRVELDSRYRNRRLFTDERAPGLYRIINDIELGNRPNYEPATLAALESAYELAPGTISRALDSGELDAPVSLTVVPAPESDPVRMLGIIKNAADAADVEPYLRQVHRELAAAVEEYGPEPPGAAVFSTEHEREIWDSSRLNANERALFIAVLRLFAAEARAEHEPRTGLVT